MKTSKLIGPTLDWAVEFIEGGCKAEPRANYWLEKWLDPKRRYLCESTSTNWAQGGSIIGRECIDLYCDHAGVSWRARKMLGERGPMAYGPTPLIAAMRCYVASKLGDEIEIPEELK